MPTTTNRGYVTAAHGGSVNTWDADLDTVFSQVDQNLGAVANVALSNVPVVLSAPQYVCGTIIFSGILTDNVLVTFPSVSGWWVVFNNCTGNFFVQMTCGAGVRVCAPPRQGTDIFTTGASVVYRNFPPVGSYADFATSSVPSWIANCTEAPYLLCDGSSFNGAVYPGLAAFLGGTTLPDARGRMRASLDGATGRITGAGGGVDGSTLMAAGGAQNRTIGQGNLPSVTLGTDIAAGQGLHRHTLNGAGNPYLGFVGALGIYTINAGGNAASFSNNDFATLPAMTGTTPLGGSNIALQTLPPIFIGGITMIRAG